jgi:acid phosphatase (class A)
MKIFSVLLAVLLCVASTPAMADSGKPMQPAPVSERVAGYLPAEAIPDSMALLPPPPAPGSPALATDEAVSRESLALRGTPRWELAKRDADLSFPEGAEVFACAVNAPINEQDTPHLYLLLRRTLADASNSTKRAKDYYRRPRPFVVNGKPSCTPDDETALAKNGSYPSGHTTVGWAWALILSELAPERAAWIINRGLVFGESRMVCNAHWESDVAAGRVMGVSTVARLHADPVFRADLEAARGELAAVRARGLKPRRDCAAEAAAMGR